MGISNWLTVAATTVSGKPEPSVGVVVATGLILVFGVLVLLYLLITLEGIIFSALDQKKKGTPAPKKESPVKKESAPAVKKAAAKAPVVETGISGEIIAAISAAIACMDGGAGYTLRSVKRVKASGRSAWGQAGVSAYTEPF